MDFVERKEYIDKIKPFINKPVIEVITGMRRVGKSTLELLKIKTDIELLEYLTPLLKDKKDVVGTNEKNIERILENIVYIELLSRGYKVNIGRVNDKEIDFIAVKGDKKEYYQVSYLLETEETRNREFGVYQKVNDNYPKYVLSMDKMNFSQNGIIQFLCERNIN